MSENQAKERRGFLGLGLSVAAAILIAVLVLVAICFVLTLFGPTIGPAVQRITKPCAIIFIAVPPNTGGYFVEGQDRDVTNLPDFTIQMTDSSGTVLYNGSARGCRLPSGSDTVTLTLTTSSNYIVADPERTVNLKFFCDSGCNWPTFAVTDVSTP